MSDGEHGIMKIPSGPTIDRVSFMVLIVTPLSTCNVYDDAFQPLSCMLYYCAGDFIIM